MPLPAFHLACLASLPQRPRGWCAKTPNFHVHLQFTVRMAVRAPTPEEFHYFYTPLPRGRLAASGASTCRSDQPSANDPRLARQDTQLAVSSLMSLDFGPRCSKTQGISSLLPPAPEGSAYRFWCFNLAILATCRKISSSTSLNKFNLPEQVQLN